MRDFTGLELDTIQSAEFSWIKKKKKTKMEMNYRETIKLVGHAAVRCERELSESQGEEVSLPQCWVNLKSRQV